ncbi:MAG: hypothetical protein GQE15_37955 [Archangiaceae bacterium]|nr:hypothetical protein [Archangiaceae bacterium]
MASPASHSNQPRFRCQWLVLSLFSTVAFGQPAPTQGRVVDRAVASVDGKVITLTQLEFETRVQLINRGGTEAAFASLDGEDLTQGLQLAIAQRLATIEADRFDAYPLEPGELEKAVADFTNRIGGEGRLQQFLDAQEADVGDVGLVLRRAIRAGRALEGRLRLKANVTEAEAKRAKADVAAWRSLPIDTVRQLLAKERFDKLVQQELTQARKTNDVRLLMAFAPDGGVL